MNNLALGLLLGASLFFICYWWIGTITWSAAIALIPGGVVALVKSLKKWRK